MGRWTIILPMFFVRWFAKRHCQRTMFTVNGVHYTYAMARPDVLILVKKVYL